MAVPRITRVLPYGTTTDTPPIGPTAGGALVEIYGAGFKLQTPGPALDPMAIPTPSVEVRFNGVVAPRVAVVRSNLLRVVTPPSSLPFSSTRGASGQLLGCQGWVDVEVVNLDAAGDPIPGESATAPVFPGVPGSYAYTYPGIGSVNDSTTTVIVKALLDAWRRDVTPNCLIHQSVDYDGNDEDGYGRIDPGELPAIVLMGPRTSTERMRSLQGDQVLDPAMVSGSPPEVRALIARMPYTLDLAFDVVGMAGARGTAMNLLHVATDYVHRTEKLVVQRTDDPAGGTAEFDIGFETAGTTFGFDRDVNESDLHTWRGAIAVRGVHVERIEALGDGGIDAVPTIQEIVVDYCKF